jgi:hypothetical protein
VELIRVFSQGSALFPFYRFPESSSINLEPPLCRLEPS